VGFRCSVEPSRAMASACTYGQGEYQGLPDAGVTLDSRGPGLLHAAPAAALDEL